MVKEQQPGFSSRFNFPGGRVETKKLLEKIALRELKEETGYVAEKIKLYKKGGFLGSTLHWPFYHFVAIGCTKQAEPSPDAGERILEIVEVEFEKLLTMMIEEKLNLLFINKDLVQAYYYPIKKAELWKKWTE